METSSLTLKNKTSPVPFLYLYTFLSYPHLSPLSINVTLEF